MAHITVEYSANLDDAVDARSVVDAVHTAALAHGLAALDALRTRAVARTCYRIADGDPAHAFVAVAARIGPGRGDDDKRTFVAALLDAAETAYTPAGDRFAIAFSAELTEIDAAFRINRNHVRTRLGGRP